jgi:nicotinate phosphoribosyltransferase
MAHSFVLAHADELEAFRRFARDHARTTLLVDTYDTLGGVRRVLELARELGPAFDLAAIRLDSGDPARLAREARALLDGAGLGRVQIFASSSLDEYAIRDLVTGGAPIDGFGVGTRMAVSEDAPSLDVVYKLVEYAGRPRAKLAPDKSSLGGRKQIFRRERDGRMSGDVIGARDERLDGRPLLAQVMSAGRRTGAGRGDLAAARERAARERDALHPRLRALEPAEPRYPVFTSDALRALQTGGP